MFLGNILPESTYVGWDAYRVNQNINAEAVLLDGKPCAHFLFAHSPSRLTFRLPEVARRFTATGIASQQPGIWGSWFYEVWIDGELKFRSPPLNSFSDRQVPIDVGIPEGARRLTLVIDDEGDNQRDHSIWAEPYLEVADPPKLRGPRSR